MAIQTTLLGTFDSGLAKIEYTWDDVSHKVQAIIVTNNSSRAAPLTLTAYGPDNVTPVQSWSGVANSGITTQPVPQSGALSVTLSSTVKGGNTFWHLPFATSISG